MAEIEIHGHKVQYDDSNHTIKAAVKHLSEKLDHSEAKPLFEAAKRDVYNHKSHFEFRDHERRLDRNMTLFHHSDGHYEIKQREHGFLR